MSLGIRIPRGLFPKALAVHQRIPLFSYRPLRFYGTHKLTKTCPSCSSPLPTCVPACPSCYNIWSIPADTSYHDIFSLPSDANPFVIDTSLLKQRFRQLQAACHPDTWASKGQDKQDAAQALSSAVNHAYQTLLYPLSRVEHILSVNGHPVEETDKLEDMEFLAEIMMAREEVENVQDSEERDTLLEQNGVRERQMISTIEKLVREERWAEVKDACIRLKYLNGISREILENYDT